MKENKTDNKLDTRLAHSKIAKTCTPKFKLKFTDFAVEKFTANFIITLPDGSIKTKGHGPFEPRSPFKFKIKTIKCNILK